MGMTAAAASSSGISLASGKKVKVKLVRYEKVKLRVPGVSADSIEWESSDTDVATVSKKGRVRAVAPGKCKIRAVTALRTYTCKVTVEPLALNKTSAVLVRGRQTILKLNNEKLKPSWSSSNTGTATVDASGRVQALKAGKCVITAVYRDEKFICSLQVLPISTDNLRKTNRAVKANRKKIVLAGSSSMDGWYTAPQAFAPYEVINMAVGGTRVTDWLEWYKDSIVRYKPSAVVVYVGSNDVRNGDNVSGADNAANTIRLLKKIHKKLKNVPIWYVSICPCWSRKNGWKDIKISNSLVRQYCKKTKDVYYIDIASAFMAADGTPDKSLFLDQLHPNAKGYQIWKKLVAKKVKKKLKKRKISP